MPQDTAHKIIRFPTSVKPWSKQYSECQHCHTSDYKHRSRGYCNHCYAILDRQGKVPYTDSWQYHQQEAREAAAYDAWDAADHLKYDPILREYVFWHLQQGHGGADRDNLVADVTYYEARAKGVFD